ncbi:DNA circularization N-terminal domain-containing protein [Azotobacter sp. CWF10]
MRCATLPYTEDLGRRAREFTITGYLVGENYHLERDTLIEVCETPRPGLLVHPYRGELTVVCRGLAVNETSQNGGLCRVSIAFLEAGEASYPRAVTDSVNAISRAGNSVISAAQAGFVERFLTDGFPGFVLKAATQRLQALTDFLAAPGGSTWPASSRPRHRSPARCATWRAMPCRSCNCPSS